MFVLPANVDIAVFSTLFNDKSVFTSANDFDSIPDAVSLAYSPLAASAESIFTALVFAIPNVNVAAQRDHR